VPHRWVMKAARRPEGKPYLGSQAKSLITSGFIVLGFSTINPQFYWGN
jgi:hypothetical protein